MFQLFFKSLALCSLFFLCFCTEEKKTNVKAGPEPVVINQARSSDARTLDPQGQFDSQSHLFVASLYDTLIGYHYLKRPYKLIPILLEKLPETEKDGKTLSFELKKGVYFHDDPCFPGGKGKELTSDDVLYTLKRFADINVNTQSWFLLSDIVEGLNEFREKTKKKTNFDYDKVVVSGLQKVDKYKFKIKLKQKNPLALYSLAASSLSIVAKEAVKKYGRAFSRNPVGTGPFRLEKYRKKQTMTFLKNKRYHRSYPTDGEKADKDNGFLADAGKKLPLVDVVNLHYIPESQPEMLKFKKGELAWVALDRDNFEQMAYFDKSGDMHLNKELKKDFELYVEPGLSSSYISFNMKDKTVQNKNLRKAIAHAIDINKKIALLSNGRGVKLYSIVPPTIPGSERDVGKFGIDYDLKKAKEYLKKAGYPGGKGLGDLVITLSGTSTTYQNYYEFMRNSLDAIGINLKPDYKTWPSYLKSTEVGDFQIAMAAWAADYPDPENFYQLFYGPNKHSSTFNNSDYNELYEKMRFMENSKERNEVIKKMALLIQEEVPVILDSTPLVSGLVQNWVSNFKRNIMVDYAFQYYNLKKAKQKAL